MDLSVPETKLTTFTPFRTYGVEVFNNYVYATTPKGIYRIINDGSANLQDFGAWELLGQAHGLPTNYSSRAIESLDGKLYASLTEQVEFSGISYSRPISPVPLKMRRATSGLQTTIKDLV